MLIDMLEHCYGVLVETNYEDYYSKDSANYRYEESKHLLDFLTFGIKVALLFRARKKKAPWFLSGLQILFIDFCYNKITDALDTNKVNINYFFVYSALEYNNAVLLSI